MQLHSDFHHLNSSQALCFNLFFPPMMGDAHEPNSFSSVMGILEAAHDLNHLMRLAQPTETK